MNIFINVAKKKATVMDTPTIICGNSGYIINFTFDSEWDGYVEKTARFKFANNGKKSYIDVLFSGTQCEVPILYDISKVMIGVFAGDLRTTTSATVNCEKSILCGDDNKQTNRKKLVDVITFNTLFANAIKNTKSGASVTMNDVSPIEHNLDIKLTSTETNSSTSVVFSFSNTEEIEYDYSNAIATINTSDGVAVANETLSEMFGIGSMGGLCLGDTLTLSYTSQNGSIRIYGDNIENHNEGSKKSISFVANKETLNKKVEFLCDDSATFSNMELDRISYLITDFSKVNVSRCGKNLFNIDDVASIYIPPDTGIPISNAVNTALKNLIPVSPNTPYTYSTPWGVRIFYYKLNGEFIKSVVAAAPQKTLTTPTNCYFVNICKALKVNEFKESQVQMESGSIATEYEPYTCETVTANTDGTVKGLTNLCPVTTLMTDTEGAIINVTYNADTKKYIDNKFAELSQALLNL